MNYLRLIGWYGSVIPKGLQGQDKSSLPYPSIVTGESVGRVSVGFPVKKAKIQEMLLTLRKDNGTQGRNLYLEPLPLLYKG